MDIGLPNVQDVWRLALPEGTELANTGGDLTRMVSWARRMSSQAPAFANLEEGEIVLLSVAAISLLDERLTLAKIVTSLATRNVAAIAVVGTVSPQAVKVADKHHICILHLPDTADLRDVEHDIIRLIVEREAQLDRRGRQIYRQLAQISIENRGLPAIVATLRDIVKKSVILHDEQFIIQTQALIDPCAFSPKELKTSLATATLDQWSGDHALDSKAPPWKYVDLNTPGWACLVTAIVIEGQLGGYLSILGSKDDLDDLDRLAAERGSLVCAMELAKQRAVIAVENRFRGDFLAMLLTTPAAEEVALTRRATEMDYNLNRQHAVILISLTRSSARAWTVVADKLRASLAGSTIQTLFCTYEEKLAALCATDDATNLKNIAHYAQTARERILALAPDVRVAMGLGQIGMGLSGLRRSFGQAREALSLAQMLFNGDKIVSFGDMGLYHLLNHLQGCDQLHNFHNQILAPLADYDREHEAQLVPTLEAFFAHLGNISQTAEALHLHRNSLLYRLERIAEISNVDLNDADDRFALQLALKVRPFVATACP
ncbi:MAG: helix-turn-helix domain-containing protein [Anaerolineae bacterium]|nr:helix-turn-helix domain-containing protein [Anaerolineae bacterium]